MTRSEGSARASLFTVALAALALVGGGLAGGAAHADWRLYVGADSGISAMDADTDGNYPTGGINNFRGKDLDSSPLVGGAFGVEIPMDEILPREWLMDVRLPDWPTRFELEGVGLREYELQTVANGEKFFSDVEVSTLFFNTWLDIPMTSVYRPVQYLFGLGRQPRVRQWLDPMSFYLGAGVGVGFTDMKGTSNVFEISDDFIDFAWNVGAGFDYSLTDRVTLGAGYRYVGLGDRKPTLLGPLGSGGNDEFELIPDIHEFRVTLRVAVYRFLSPWR